MLGSSVQTAGRTLGSAITFGMDDDIAITFGSSTDASILWETADANANALIIALPEGGDVNVPILVIGDASISNADLTFFNGITEPSIAVLDDDKSSYLLMGFYANGQPALRSADAITIMPSGDVDDYFTFSTASNIPTITATGAAGLRIDSPLGLGRDPDAGFVVAAASGTWYMGGGTLSTLAAINLSSTGIIAVDGAGDGTYFLLDAKDTGVGNLEVARSQGAADPYFSMGGAQQHKFYNSGIISFTGLPTSDPAVAGQLYTSTGALKVSAG